MVSRPITHFATWFGMMYVHIFLYRLRCVYFSSFSIAHTHGEYKKLLSHVGSDQYLPVPAVSLMLLLAGFLGDHGSWRCFSLFIDITEDETSRMFRQLVKISVGAM